MDGKLDAEQNEPSEGRPQPLGEAALAENVRMHRLLLYLRPKYAEDEYFGQVRHVSASAPNNWLHCASSRKRRAPRRNVDLGLRSWPTLLAVCLLYAAPPEACSTSNALLLMVPA
jgi:hypothetical protein